MKIPERGAPRHVLSLDLTSDLLASVMADPGVRSGLDIDPMLAMGAKAVWLGRL